MDTDLTTSGLSLWLTVGIPATIGAIVGLCYTLWLMYLGVMQLMQRRDEGTLSTLDKVFGYPTLAVGYVKDLVLNVLMSFWMVELPKELTVSSRCLRHARDALLRAKYPETYPAPTRLQTWRRHWALWLLMQIDDHDKSGGHTPKI